MIYNGIYGDVEPPVDDGGHPAGAPNQRHCLDPSGSGFPRHGTILPGSSPECTHHRQCSCLL